MIAGAHFSKYNSIPASILGFAEYARSYGFNIGINEAREAINIAEAGLINKSNLFRYSLKAIFSCSQEDSMLFDQLYDSYWGIKHMAIKSRISHHVKSNIQRKEPESLVLLGEGKDEDPQTENNKNVSGANKIERLRHTDFAKIEEIESEFLEELASKLWKQMSLRLKKKLKKTKKGKIDIRSTIRSNLSNGGNLLELKYKNRIFIKQRLILILDVSGSMDKYSFYLLRFIFELSSHFKNIEVFIFSTRLVRVTEIIKDKNWNSSLSLLAAKADHWSSGTKIGECFKFFNQNFAKKVLNGKSTTIILSDGLDTGEPELLSTQLGLIKRRTKKVIWLNPLKGMEGYEPIARGMKAAMPSIDVFNSSHSLDSIMELEKFLIDV